MNVVTHNKAPQEYLIFLDTETTGLDANVNHVAEVAFRVINALTRETVCSYESVVKLTEEEFKVAHPKALEVNSFTFKEVQEKGKKRDEIAAEIHALFLKHHVSRANAKFFCQNPSFDRPFFAQIISVADHEAHKYPYHWFDLASMEYGHQLRLITQCGKKYEKMYSSKDNIAKRLGIGPEDKPHRAMQGVDHLVRCFWGVLDSKEGTTPDSKKRKVEE